MEDDGEPDCLYYSGSTPFNRDNTLLLLGIFKQRAN
jgi:hypothetical protein